MQTNVMSPAAILCSKLAPEDFLTLETCARTIWTHHMQMETMTEIAEHMAKPIPEPVPNAREMRPSTPPLSMSIL
jgi:hypothetical protein